MCFLWLELCYLLLFIARAGSGGPGMAGARRRSNGNESENDAVNGPRRVVRTFRVRVRVSWWIIYCPFDARCFYAASRFVKHRIWCGLFIFTSLLVPAAAAAAARSATHNAVFNGVWVCQPSWHVRFVCNKRPEMWGNVAYCCLSHWSVVAPLISEFGSNGVCIMLRKWKIEHIVVNQHPNRSLVSFKFDFIW